MTRYLTARTRIAVGLVSLLFCVFVAAMTLSLVPDPRPAAMAGRLALCETLAVNSAVLVERSDYQPMHAILSVVVQRNRDVLSAGIRRADGELLVEVDEHEANWTPLPDNRSTDSQIYVPIRSAAGDQQWGGIEVRFVPLVQAGWLGYVDSPKVKLIAFVLAASMIAFYLYLGKMLRHLNPMKAVPNRVRSALDTLAEGLLVIDKDERIVLANHAFATIAGSSPDDLTGRRASELPWLSEDGVPAKTHPWAETLEQRTPQTGVTMRLAISPTNERVFNVNCAPVLGSGKDHLGVLISCEDVTEFERQKVELAKSKEAAEAASNAKSEFLANVSHEIRTPMHAILGFTEALRRGYETNEGERQEYLDTIRASGSHLLELINDVLDMSKIESGRLDVERRQCSAHEVITGVVKVFQVRAREKGISLQYESLGIPETIMTDAGRLRQILTNLIGNAVKFTETGGVLVRSRLVQKAAESRLAVDVIDTGIGVAAAELSNIFEPFAQADSSARRRHTGTGLGLAISRRFARALGGDVTARSELGKGSMFTATVDTGPLEGVQILKDATCGLPVAKDASREQMRLDLSGLHVLVADDGEPNRRFLGLVLRRGGAVVDCVANGRLAIERAHEQKYDAILMDMQMPVMDGFVAATRLRQDGVTTPIIALTADARKGMEKRCRDAGCSGFLIKPINIDQLLEHLANATGRHASAPPSSGELGSNSGTGGEERESVVGQGNATRKTPSPAASEQTRTMSTPRGDSSARAPITSSLPVDDAEFPEIVEEFVGHLGNQLKALCGAWQKKDYEQIAFLAHWLKGAAGTMGFQQFTAPARRLQHLAEQRQVGQIGDAIREVVDLAARIVVPSAETTPA